MADGSGSSGVRMMRSIALLRTWSRAKTQSVNITFPPTARARVHIFVQFSQWRLGFCLFRD